MTVGWHRKVSDFIRENFIVRGRRGLLEVRRGLIFWAYDIGEKETAKELTDRVWEYINTAVVDDEAEERIRIDKEIWHQVMGELDFDK